jgi:23S rRNA (cytosine1962-C5)-methyltransferase
MYLMRSSVAGGQGVLGTARPSSLYKGRPSGSLSGTLARPNVTLAKDLSRSVRRGHPWLYRQALRPSAPIAEGALVDVLDGRGRKLATGFWDATGPIAVRVLSTEPLEDAAALVRSRLHAALAVRLAAFDLERTNAFRLVHGEGDRLPGVHVDVYGAFASVRFDGLGARAFYGALWSSLLELPGLPIETVVDRERRAQSIPTEVRENGLLFDVDLGSGQKGGLFLDQRENREEVERRAKGRRVLNLFGYTGAFSLYAARGGARSTDTVDQAKPAIAAARRNFEKNGFDLEKAGFFAADAFTFLEAAAREGRRWDLVISDPPSFAKSKSSLPSARDAYRRLHRLAASVVEKGGVFCPASCSSHVTREDFVRLVEDGVRAAGRRFRLEELRGAGIDHPSLPGFSEGDYLKLAFGVID